MGEPGIAAVRKILRSFRKEKSIDTVIAQGENVTEGRGISARNFQELRGMGIDFVTGGNWSHYRKDILPMLSDPNQPIIRPANYPVDTPGLGYKYAKAKNREVLVISLLGKIVGKDSDKPLDNPLQVIDRILEEQEAHKRIATIVNFHGDYSSEKRIIGYYLDGRVTAVIGDHWHVPTADAMVLPKGTAHITDVGMCGTIHSSLGISLDSVIPRWRDGVVNKNKLETVGPLQFNAVLIEVDPDTGFAKSIESVQRVM